MKLYKIIPMIIAGAMTMEACSEWNDHFDESPITVTEGDVDIYSGTVTQYLQQAQDLTQMNALLQQNGIYDATPADGQYTFIVCADGTFSTAGIVDTKAFAQYSVADMGVAPSKLTDGSGINTRSGKTVWVGDGGRKLDQCNITKTVKASNGFIYYVDGVLPVRQSAYELLLSLGDNYSRFKELVTAFDTVYFDQENSKPIGMTDDGRVVYDSVKVVRNTLMDRYNANGNATWDMRSESYTTTMFIPTNEQVDKAITAALDSIPQWLHREATDADRVKFEKWIVSACFSDRRLQPADVAVSAPDIKCVEGYQQVIDETSDVVSYTNVEGSWWRPSVQRVNTAAPVSLSNGVAYYCENLKIPNHVVIYRVKSRFYELWNNMTDEEKTRYFDWDNWEDPQIINDCQGQFDLIASGVNVQWPSIYYHELTAVPTQEAMEKQLPCSVEYSGLTWDEELQQLSEVNLPAGEYYLRMGFKHSLLYSLSIAFNGTWLKTDMNMHATGSDYHFDRGAASPVPHYGEEFGIAYPEGFDVDYWQKQNEKAIAYDTDGYTVGTVTLRNSGNFRIRVTSNDMARIYKQQLDNGVTLARNKNNVNQLMMYHWCLRPTHNNY